MDILNTVSLESNSQIKINFDGAIYPPMQDFSCLKSSCLRLELLSSSIVCSKPMIPHGFVSIRMMRI